MMEFEQASKAWQTIKDIDPIAEAERLTGERDSEAKANYELLKLLKSLQANETTWSHFPADSWADSVNTTYYVLPHPSQ